MIDHLLAAVFGVGFPAVNIPLYARRRARLAAGDRALKRREYQETIAWLAGMGVATLAVWLVLRRDPAALGLAFPTSWRALAGLAAATGVALLLLAQVRGVRRDPAARERVREGLGSVREFLPGTASELRWFRGVSLSAGIGEELFYRGFLIWYLDRVLPLAGAIAVSAIVFGAAHLMHGRDAFVRSTIMGGVLAALYGFTGALWAPMVLHAAVDLSSGALGMAAADSSDQA